MKNLIALIILITITSASARAQFEQVFSEANVQSQTTHTRMPDNRATTSTHRGTTESLAPVPKDIADMTGKWYSDKNECVVAMQWDGQKWLGTILNGSESNRFNMGEIIIELFPNKTDRAFGRMKVIRNKKSSKWQKVKYKVKLTKLDGNNSWEFYGK